MQIAHATEGIVHIRCNPFKGVIQEIPLMQHLVMEWVFQPFQQGGHFPFQVIAFRYIYSLYVSEQ